MWHFGRGNVLSIYSYQRQACCTQKKQLFHVFNFLGHIIVPGSKLSNGSNICSYCCILYTSTEKVPGLILLVPVSGSATLRKIEWVFGSSAIVLARTWVARV